MPELVPVDHDPFASQFMPVDHDPWAPGAPSLNFTPVEHDPFAVSQDSTLSASMTHQPEQPNSAQPYIDTAQRYLQSGDYDPVHLPGTRPADYLRELSRNPDILAKNIEQAGNFNFVGVAGRPRGYWSEGEGVDILKRLNDEGKSQAEIADILGLSRPRTSFLFKQHGLEPNFTRTEFGLPRAEIDIDKAKAMMKAGMSLSEMGREFGVSNATVHRKLKDAGLKSSVEPGRKVIDEPLPASASTDWVTLPDGTLGRRT